MPTGQRGQEVSSLELEEDANAARLGQPHRVVQSRRLGDAHRVVCQIESCRFLEGQGTAAGTGADDHRLSGFELICHRLPKRHRAKRRSNDVNQLRIDQSLIDVMPGARDIRKAGDVAIGLDAFLRNNRCDVVRKVGKIENPDFMSM